MVAYSVDKIKGEWIVGYSVIEPATDSGSGSGISEGTLLGSPIIRGNNERIRNDGYSIKLTIPLIHHLTGTMER